MRDFFLIAKQAFLTKARTKAFFIVTLVVIAGMFLTSNLPIIIDNAKNAGLFGGGADENEIFVVDETNELADAFSAQMKSLNDEYKVTKTSDPIEQLKQKVKDEDISSFVVLDANESNIIQATYTSKNANEMTKPQLVQQALQLVQTNYMAAKMNLSADQVQALFKPVSFETKAVSASSKTEEELSQARGLVYVLIFVIYFSVIYYSNMIAMEVATEKSSRVMEIIISSVSPVKHMFGKIVGVGTLGLLQMALFGLAGYAALKTTKSEMTEGFFSIFGFSNVSISTIAFAIIFFLLGYFLYATLAALLASLVSRTEDVQQLIMPMTLLIVVASILAFSGIGDPEAKFVTIASYIPVFTPLVMFLRVGMLDLPVWEPILGIVLTLLTIFLLGWFGSRVYRGGVLMYGPSRSLKDIKRAIQLGKE